MNSIQDKELDPLAYRYLLLTAHYRTQMNFSWESLEAAQTAYHNLLSEIARKREVKKSASITSYQKKFKTFISDDLDTLKALALLWEIVKNPKLDNKSVGKLVKEFDEVLGLDLINKSKELSKEQSDIPQSISKLADERWELRKNKEFDKADKIRLTLAKKGYEVEDLEDDFIVKKLVK
jgi:cysteinyl-tRNA synthetase